MSHEFEWDEKYSVQVKEIDDQHKKLVDLIFQLFNSINKHSTKEELGGILEELIEYASYHFSTEEKYFNKFNYKNSAEHIEEHKQFVEKVSDLNKKYLNNEIEISFELIDYLEDWLLDHLVDSDQKYVECFKEKGLK